jgi:uncharacterized protein YjbJ (UPF0337 family)
VKDNTKDKSEGAGRTNHNPALEDEGKDEKLGGEIHKQVGHIEKVVEK